MIGSERMPSNRISDDSPSKSREEIDSLLKLAEELQEKCDSMSKRIEQYRFGQIALVLIAILVGIFSIWIKPPSESFEKMFIAVLVTGQLSYAGLFEYIIRRNKRRREPERDALVEVVELLRETGTGIAEAEKWSALDRAEFRIRLSRFGIGHSKYRSY